jgi:hypothetical protein
MGVHGRQRIAEEFFQGADYLVRDIFFDLGDYNTYGFFSPDCGCVEADLGKQNLMLRGRRIA